MQRKAESKTQRCIDGEGSFSLLDSSIKRRVIACRLVIKSTNHARHFPLIWFPLRFWLFRFCVRCLAIIRRFILWRVSDEKVLSLCWKYDIPLFFAILKFCSTKHLFINHSLELQRKAESYFQHAKSTYFSSTLVRVWNIG